MSSQDEMLDYFDSLSSEEAVEALEELEAYEGYDAKGNDLRNQCVALTYHYLRGYRCLLLCTAYPTANTDAQISRVCEASQKPLCIHRCVH